MKRLHILAAGLIGGALAFPCAGMAQGYGGNTPEGRLPSQRLVNTSPNGRGATMTLSPAMVRRVQQALNRLGYGAGPLNGSWNRRTSIAMRDFQMAHGLAPTGTIDRVTLRALGVGPTAYGGGYAGGGGGGIGGNGLGGVGGGYGGRVGYGGGGYANGGGGYGGGGYGGGYAGGYGGGGYGGGGYGGGGYGGGGSLSQIR